MRKKNAFTVLDLFSGCGGFSFGFQEAGFRVLFGVDNDPTALKTFEANHLGAKGLCVDLGSRAGLKDVIEKLEGQIPDVLIAGPPCQGFSLTGTRNKHDSRNKLFNSAFGLIDRLSAPPMAVVIENVPGLGTLYKGAALKAIYRGLEARGYNVAHKVLFAPEYGVPQIRKRIFIVGLIESGIEFEFPNPCFVSEEEYVTCSDAISDLPSRQGSVGEECSEYSTPPESDYQRKMRGGAKILYNHVASRHSEEVRRVISLVPEGGNYRDLPPGVGESRRFNEAWTRYHSKKPSRTIDTGHRNHFHYNYNRVPTVRENARLQSFPDTFVFFGSRTHQYRQVGNAVPPLLGFHLGRALLKVMKRLCR